MIGINKNYPAISTGRRRPVAVDLFAGAGGFSLGIEQAGFDVLVAVEHDPVHACTYAFNFPLTKVLCTDVATITAQMITDAAKESWLAHHNPQTRTRTYTPSQIDLIFGGPPCQGFSMMGKRLFNDDRNSLVFHFYRLVIELAPRYFVMENVPGMSVGEHRLWLKQLKNQFEAAGYSVRVQILNAAHFGVPQKRHRLFVVGAQQGVLPAFLPKTPVITPVTVRDALADLPDLETFPQLETTDELLLNESQLLDIEQKASCYAQILRSHPSQDRRNLSYPRLWNRQLLTSSMQTQHSEETRNRFAETKSNQIEKISHLRRLDFDGMSYTLRAGTGYGRGSHTSPRPIHPTFPRVISVREAARLHSFPDWFRLHQTKWHGFRQVGNSVPPLLARAVGEKIVEALCVTPLVPKATLPLGDTELIRFEPTQARDYWQANFLIPDHLKA